MITQPTTQGIADITIRLALLALVIAWCLLLILPFSGIILWSLILTLVFNPLHIFLTKKFGGRSRLASVSIVLTGLVILFIPTYLFMESLVDGVKVMIEHFKVGTLTIPPPNEDVRTWPIIGESLYSLWYSASLNLRDFIIKYQHEIAVYGKQLVQGLLSFSGTILQMVAAFVIAGILLSVKGIGEAGKKIFRKIFGDRGDEFAGVVQNTVNNVVKGVLGVALIQTIMIGIGFLLIGIPYAGLWTLLVMILSFLQIPVTLVTVPVAIYLFSELSLVPAILWSIYLLIGGMVDNVIKPIILGKGAQVPTLVIFLGVLGGFILSGFIGLFTGAIVLSIGYKLFLLWLNPQDEVANLNKHSL